jgi:hypothetical protein
MGIRKKLDLVVAKAMYVKFVLLKVKVGLFLVKASCILCEIEKRRVYQNMCQSFAIWHWVRARVSILCYLGLGESIVGLFEGVLIL